MLKMAARHVAFKVLKNQKMAESRNLKSMGIEQNSKMASSHVTMKFPETSKIHGGKSQATLKK